LAAAVQELIRLMEQPVITLYLAPLLPLAAALGVGVLLVVLLAAMVVLVVGDKDMVLLQLAVRATPHL
jgi:hypothetical protein